jgi:tetratricopeptide (TPR) repeat protein
MKYKFFVFSLLNILATSISFQIYSQDISPKESEEIRLAAKKKVNNYKDLLNFIADESIGDAEKSAAIEDCYGASNTKVFHNAEAIIEDDINPKNFNSSSFQDLSVEKYLNNLDVLYTKSSENTIELTVTKVSNVKKADYLYIKVYFESFFGSKHKTINSPYQKTLRVAELKVEKINKKWITNITKIAFVTQEDSLTYIKNDIILKNNIVLLDSLSADLLMKAENEKLLKEAEEQRKLRAAFEKLLTDADDAFKTQEYDLALQAYGDVQKKYKDEYDNAFYIKKQISLAKKGILKEEERKQKEAEQKRLLEEKRALEERENAYRKYISDARFAERARKYNKSLKLYQAAFDIKPDSSLRYQDNIRYLNEMLSIKTELDEMYSVKNFKELKKKYDELIDKKRIDNNSDYYLGRAKCLMSLGENNKYILKDLDQAVSLDYANSEALKLRAEFYLQQNNLPKAIADYTSFLNVEKDSASVYRIRASLRIQTNNIEGAFEDYDKCIELNPKNANFYFDRARLNTQNSFWIKAISDYSSAIRLDSNNALSYYHRGEAHFNLLNFKEAGVDFRQAIARRLQDDLVGDISNRTETLYTEGELAFNRMELDVAQKLYTNVIFINPKLSKAWFKIGECYFIRKEFTKAIENYNLAIKNNSQDADAFYKKGLSRFEMGAYRESIVEFRKASEINPIYFVAMFWEASALMKLKNYQEAINPLQRINVPEKEIDKYFSKSFFAEVHNNLGICLYKIKNYQEALPQFTTSLKFNLQFAEAFFYRGLTYNELGKYNDAIEDIQKSINFDPDKIEKFVEISKVYYTVGKYNDALSNLQTSINLDKNNIYQADLYVSKGNCNLYLERYKEATEDFLKVIELDSKKGDMYLYKTLSTAFLFNGQPQEAYDAINKALNMDSTYTEAKYVLACYHVQKSNNVEALAILEKLLQTKYIDAQFIKKDKLLNFINKEFRNNKDLKIMIKKYAN